MVGLAIGMLGVIVMMQVFMLSEGDKRTTTGDNDAHNNGAIALNGLQRDIRTGGYGITALGVLGCPAIVNGATLTMAPVMINPIAIPAGDANTDTLLVIYGNGKGSDTANGDSTAVVGDYKLAVNVIADGSCPAATPTLMTGAVAGTVFNLGAAPRILAYRVVSGNLTVCNFLTTNCTLAAAANWTPVGDNIVSLRAEYGKSAILPAVGIEYAQAPHTSLTPGCNWIKIPAIRIALVARSGQYDKGIVTLAAPTWAGTFSATSVPITLTADANWQHYRYKTFETTVPIRNVTWGTAC